MNPEELRFATTHEWIHIDRGGSADPIATVGISAFAVEALTDLVYIELPKVGQQVVARQSFSEIESVKAVSDIYAPINGEVIAVNEQLPDHLETLARDPYGEGWIAKIRIRDDSELDDLMPYEAYQKQCAEEEH